MDIQIKKVKFGLLGREGIRTFQCQLFIDGKHTADVNEDGNGGCLHIYFFDPECRQINEAANKWLKENHKTGEFVCDLDTKIIELVSDIETQKQLDKDQKKGICWRKPGDNKENYIITKWNISLDKMLSNPGGIIAVKDKIAQIKSEGGIILNNNLNF